MRNEKDDANYHFPVSIMPTKYVQIFKNLNFITIKLWV